MLPGYTKNMSKTMNEDFETDDNCTDICPKTGGEHTFGPDSVSPVKGSWIVDVCCDACGRSGAIAVSPADVQW